MTYQYFNFGTRVIYFGSLKDELPINMSTPFSVLLPASNETECLEAGKFIPTLLEMGCMEFCCVGSESEFLHDEIDSIIEDRGAFEVVTTYDVDEVEGCEYFLFAAGGGANSLLALVSEHPNLLNGLQNAVRRIL
ncbi:hypothetical protein B0F87_104148 [Methylobacter tundripaludum]|uniref:Uncharacterized protein n=1 Tax=Methylobacter tundripaludum TaxID=173365 RepID=A0A2S6HF02_9GAMM|nr:hypothetical protein [Methylobacter tundripaludum]PPK76058.1 hypothetical protein B0F87_104148 [Methylobacter tundripaludum]